MKKIISILLSFLGFFWRFIPLFLRDFFLRGLLALESTGKNEKVFKRLFAHKKFISKLINSRAVELNNGIHPKHHLTKYHNFFIENINKDIQSVLDIGSGNGFVAHEIAKKFDKIEVVGIDRNKYNIENSTQNFNLSNLKFIEGDVLYYKFEKNFDVVILSNILEHIDQRTKFLKKLISQTNPKLLFIRVPLFERDWEIPFKKKLNINYFTDDEHFIEHSIQEFKEEMNKSNLKISKLLTIWGEIWCVCET
ncbi:class I SAM-dependent methyltransferase [Candidatus Pelagibacter sp.]|nr:class I SAM-dependent methyltransferase [Candidatus Pelagibacter sp.]